MPKFEIPRSNPIGEFLHGGGHPFPERIEELVRMIDVIDEEHLLPFMNTAHDWEGGRELDAGEGVAGATGDDLEEGRGNNGAKTQRAAHGAITQLPVVQDEVDGWRHCLSDLRIQPGKAHGRHRMVFAMQGVCASEQPGGQEHVGELLQILRRADGSVESVGATGLTRIGEDRSSPRGPAMRLPRFRFSVRWLMLAVLVSALSAWWLLGRPAWFARVARENSQQYSAHTTFHEERYGTQTMLISNTTMMGEWHLIMSRRYDRAADHPWRRIGPDPKPPKPGDVLIYDPQDEEFERHFGTLEEQRQLLNRRR